jgi:hypothetical protein
MSSSKEPQRTYFDAAGDPQAVHHTVGNEGW